MLSSLATIKKRVEAKCNESNPRTEQVIQTCLRHMAEESSDLYILQSGKRSQRKTTKFFVGVFSYPTIISIANLQKIVKR